MSIERELDGKIGSMTWWLDNIWMTEAERRDRGIKPPASQFWVDELNTVRVFDQLIYNTDRNQGNLLITPEWKVWMIDHTRAFRHIGRVAEKERSSRTDRSQGASRTSATEHAPTEEGTRAPTCDRRRSAPSWPPRPDRARTSIARSSTRVKISVLTGMPRKTPEVSLP